MKFSHLVDPLLLSSALLLGGYLVLTAEDPTQEEAAARKENILPAFSPESIVSLKWETPERLILRKDTGSEDPTRYFLGEDGQRVADEEVVRALLQALDLATFKRTLGSAKHVESNSLGFDEPSLEMRVDAGPRSFRILIGAEAPAPPHSVYLKVEGANVDQVVGVVDAALLTSLAKTRQEFLGGLVFPLARSETSSLSIRQGETRTELRPDADSFFVERPNAQPLAADRESVDLMFFQLSRTKPQSYLPKLPEEPPTLTIEQKGSDGASFLADFGPGCPDDPLAIVVHRKKPDELIGCVPGAIFSAFRVPEERLISRTATIMTPDEIDHVIVRNGERSLDVVRDEVDYKLLSHASKLVPREAGDDFFRTLASTRHAIVEAPPEHAREVGAILFKGQVRNTARTESTEGTDHTYQTESPLLQADENLYLHRQTDGVWLAISSDASWPYLASTEWANDRKLASFRETDIKNVKVTLPGGSTWQVEGEDGSYILNGSKDQAADPLLTRELFRELSNLSAERYLTPARPRPTSGGVKLDFQVQGKDGPEHHHLLIGGRVRGGYLAWSDLAEGTFVLRLGARRILTTPLTDRRVLQLDLDELSALSLESEGRTLMFEREGELFHAKTAGADDELVAPLKSALDSIHVISAAGGLPEARDVERGSPTLTLTSIARSAPGTVQKLHLGRPTVWMGASCRTAWLEGSKETFFVEESSLLELLELI